MRDAKKLSLQAESRSVSERDHWSDGVLEYWVLNASLHYSITPLFQSLLGLLCGNQLLEILDSLLPAWMGGQERYL